MGFFDRIKSVLGANQHAATFRLLDGLLEELEVIQATNGQETAIPENSENAAALLASDQDSLRWIYSALLGQLLQAKKKRGQPADYPRWRRQVLILEMLLEAGLPLVSEELEALLKWLNPQIKRMTHLLPLSGTTTALQAFGARNSKFTPALLTHCTEFLEQLSDSSFDDACRVCLDAISLLLSETKMKILIDPSDPWAQLAINDLDAFDQSERAAWATFLAHCQSASAGKPTKKRQDETHHLFTLHPKLRQQFIDLGPRWFAAAGKAAAEDRTKDYYGHETSMHPLELAESNQDILKGLAWAAGSVDDSGLTRALGTMAASLYRKIPGIGPRAVRAGNACIVGLQLLANDDALAQLAVLKVKVKFGTAQRLIDRALEAAAERAGVTAEDIAELAVPGYGFDEVGQLEQAFGENFTARLTITGTTSTKLAWVKPDGKIQKTVPAAVRQDFTDDLKELRAIAKDVQKMLPAQRDRIDQLFLSKKSWDWNVFRERYLDHPIVGTLARRVIWTACRKSDGEPQFDFVLLEGELIDADGNRHEVSNPEETIVQIWHPIDRETNDVMLWRDLLDKHEITQPFKQAYREIYVLTDAERNTSSYSNRYAAHIIKQHQFNALCQARGWKNQLRLAVDDAYHPPYRLLPAWNMRAEFWVEGIGGDWGIDLTESGSYLHLATDQVRFYVIDSEIVSAHASGGGYGHGWRSDDTGDPLQMSDIPPLVFSEIMRDVDLFVGVGSVGNDPNWNDGGPGGRHVDYWQDYSFGELNATAKTRLAVLERLIPRLKIAERCKLDGRFLHVQGKRRGYKIHLGSGNILMTPGDQYLCIVPGAKMPGTAAAAKLHLPFEGDRTISIILSKAFLLAEDDKIKDPTILSQIGK